MILDKGQSLFYSVEYALKRLLQNDEFAENFFKKSSSQVELAVDAGLLTSQKVDENMTAPQATGIYKQYYDRHLREYHGKDSNSFEHVVFEGGVADCMISDVARIYANADMSDFDEPGALSAFQKRMPLDTDGIQALSAMPMLSACNDIALSNDVLVETEFSDSPAVRRASNYVNVTVLNARTNHAFRQKMTDQTQTMDVVPSLGECTYIYKRWLSGFKELYVYLPTTFTYYQENMHGEDVNKNATWICLRINKRHFQFNHIYQAHICGQSLPMQIHNEEAGHFNDVILPSMLRTMCTSDDEAVNTQMIYDSYNAQYVLYFVCYGSDSQAIRIFGD